LENSAKETEKLTLKNRHLHYLQIQLGVYENLKENSFLKNLFKTEGK